MTNHTPNTEQRERELFEAWARPFYILDRTSEGKYEWQGAYIAWFAWQAARATHAAPASPEPCPNKAHMAEYACANRLQCWEPCGELGHSADHARAVPASPNTGAVKDHNVRQLVNDLREIALKFHATGQLRERISGAVHQFLAPIRATPSPSKGGEADSAAEGDNHG